MSEYRAACGNHTNGSDGLIDRALTFVRSKLVASAMTKILELRHPGSLESLPRPLAQAEGEPGSALRPASELQSRRYGWPERQFSEENSVIGEFGSEPWLSLRAGDAAVDFTLRDERGADCHLARLLKSRPVCLTFGMYTCPAYQASKAAEAELAKRYGNGVHFLHLYTLEPHPKGSNAPDVGRPWELMYSSKAQPLDSATRQQHALDIAPNHPECQRILADTFEPTGLVNPVWSTYGPAPRPGFLIRRDGIIDTSQLWFAAGHMQAAIERLISESCES